MSAFDDALDALEVAEEHAADVRSLEEDEALKLLAVYQRVAERLRARLRRLPKDTFTAQQVRVTLLQLEAALLSFETELRDQTIAGARIMRDKGIRHLVREVSKFDDYFRGALQPINLDAMLASLDDSKRLYNQYDVSVRTYTEGLRKQLSFNITQMQAERATPEQIYTRLIEQDGIASFFDGEAWKLRRIVRTEMHGIYSQGKLSALGEYARTEPEMRKALFHPMDARTADDSLWVHGKQEADEVSGRGLRLRPRLNEPFEYTWKSPNGKRYRRVFMSPPDRPNDRSILVPYHPSWETDE